jgi:Fe/S biogenesis protein NfuA
VDQPLIEITPAAQDKLLQLLAEKKQDLAGLLLGIKGRGPAGFEYFMRFVPAAERPQDAVTFGAGGLTVFIENQDAEKLKGALVDFSPSRGGFHIENPNPAWAWEDPLAQSVQNVLTDQINPAIAAHGGWVQLLDVKEGVAYIELGGGCVGCGLVDVTLKQGIEVAIKQAVPAIHAVVDRTDHASGTNPYYQASKADPYHQPAKGEPAPRSPFG